MLNFLFVFFFSECGMHSGYFNILLSILLSNDLFDYNMLPELIHDEFSREEEKEKKKMPNFLREI